MRSNDASSASTWVEASFEVILETSSWGLVPFWLWTLECRPWVAFPDPEWSCGRCSPWSWLFDDILRNFLCRGSDCQYVTQCSKQSEGTLDWWGWKWEVIWESPAASTFWQWKDSRKFFWHFSRENGAPNPCWKAWTTCQDLFNLFIQQNILLKTNTKLVELLRAIGRFHWLIQHTCRLSSCDLPLHWSWVRVQGFAVCICRSFSQPASTTQSLPLWPQIDLDDPPSRLRTTAYFVKWKVSLWSRLT